MTKKDFPQEPFCPPSVETATLEAAPRPLGSVIKVDLAEDVGTDGGGSTEDLNFEVQIRDCNEDEVLQRWVILDDAAILPDTIAPTQRNPHSFDLSGFRGDLTPGVCHRVELRVSGSFVFSEPGTPVDAQDLGTATWWIAAYDSSDPEAAGVEMVSCR